MQTSKLNNALFSLFHHDVSTTLSEKSYFTDKLWNNLQQPISVTENEIGEEILSILKENTKNIE